MSATNKTTNYELPKFIGTDKPTFLGDWNNAMDKIDTAIKGVSDSANSGTSATPSIDYDSIFNKIFKLNKYAITDSNISLSSNTTWNNMTNNLYIKYNEDKSLLHFGGNLIFSFTNNTTFILNAPKITITLPENLPLNINETFTSSIFTGLKDISNDYSSTSGDLQNIIDFVLNSENNTITINTNTISYNKQNINTFKIIIAIPEITIINKAFIESQDLDELNSVITNIL